MDQGFFGFDVVGVGHDGRDSLVCNIAVWRVLVCKTVLLCCEAQPPLFTLPNSKKAITQLAAVVAVCAYCILLLLLLYLLPVVIYALRLQRFPGSCFVFFTTINYCWG